MLRIDLIPRPFRRRRALFFLRLRENAPQVLAHIAFYGALYGAIGLAGIVALPFAVVLAILVGPPTLLVLFFFRWSAILRTPAGGVSCLLIECAPQEQAAVRQTIRDVLPRSPILPFVPAETMPETSALPSTDSDFPYRNIHAFITLGPAPSSKRLEGRAFEALDAHSKPLFFGEPGILCYGGRASIECLARHLETVSVPCRVVRRARAPKGVVEWKTGTLLESPEEALERLSLVLADYVYPPPPPFDDGLPRCGN